MGLDIKFQFPARNSVCSDLHVVVGSAGAQAEFQFPARNSVCSDVKSAASAVAVIIVSIPRSEFCLFGLSSFLTDGAFRSTVSIPRSEFCLFGLPRVAAPVWAMCNVSIPRSEFCLFGPERAMLGSILIDSFNSPLGILFVRTLGRKGIGGYKMPFQFPARNSVCSDFWRSSAK